MVYFGLQFCYLIRKFCIQTWNSVSDAIKSVCTNKCEFGEIGIVKTTLLLAPIFHYALQLCINTCTQCTLVVIETAHESGLFRGSNGNNHITL